MGIGLTIISLIPIFIGGREYHETKRVSIVTLVIFLFMFLGSIGTGIVPAEYFGLFERFSVFSVVIFTVLLGLFGYTYKSPQA